MSRKSELAQIWAERISDCQADGSNIKSWCRDNNVSASQYYYWIKKLNANDNEIIEGEGVEWAEVSLVSQKQNMNNGNSIILNYNDFKIEIPKNIKRGDIAEVLAAIVSVC
ncbi:IS66 family insertion sequence element accessory protein TnpA [Clostridium chrysemydis]|uniref:IS66 family insertion sequence element accessory protein TnpA n=1 Tax=Clostridium chrysemydis TaxID=2665504 RepID=UPI003F33C195